MHIVKLDPATIRRIGEHSTLPGPFICDPESGQIELDDEVYDELKRRADNASVTVADMIKELVW